MNPRNILTSIVMVLCIVSGNATAQRTKACEGAAEQENCEGCVNNETFDSCVNTVSTSADVELSSDENDCADCTLEITMIVSFDPLCMFLNPDWEFVAKAGVHGPADFEGDFDKDVSLNSSHQLSVTYSEALACSEENNSTECMSAWFGYGASAGSVGSASYCYTATCKKCRKLSEQ